MQFTAATVIAAMAFLPAAMGAVVARQNGVTCQTSSGSPSTGDVTATINEIRGKGGKCVQGNGSASMCSTLVSQGSAAIGVCGEEDDESNALDCEQVAAYANDIQQTCIDGNGFVGGTFTVSASKRVIVFSSGDD